MIHCTFEKLLNNITSSDIIPAISVAVAHNGKIVYSGAFGKIYENGEKIVRDSRFDIASMTKIFSGISFMKLVELGYIGLHDPICEIFPEFDVKKPIEENGIRIGYCDASKVTWFHVLTHTSGMGWTRPKTRPSLPNLDKGLDDIFSLPFAYPTGKRVVYSDIPIILMGKAMEHVSKRTLDELVDSLICKPLSLSHTGFLRISEAEPLLNMIVPTEMDTVFRKKRIWGEVHDENAFLLDGVSAHAGIFSTAEDICKLLLYYSECFTQNGILETSTVMKMVQEHAKEDSDRRGIMWQLSNSGDNTYTRCLSHNAYGHSGFTGCFCWNDPEKNLTVVLLSNDVYNGRENRKLFNFREEIMQFIVDAYCI